MIRSMSVAISLSGLAGAVALAGAGCSASEPVPGSIYGAGATSVAGSSSSVAGAPIANGGSYSSAGAAVLPGAGGSPVEPSAGAFSTGGATGVAGGGGFNAGGTLGSAGSSAGGASAGRGGSAGKGNGSAGNGSAGKGGGSAGASGGSAGGSATGCDAPGLVWKTAAKTNFVSYPAPGSAECIQYSGCMYEGQFAACSKTEPLSWVKTHNIVSVFPDLKTLQLHDLCLKSGTKTIVVTAIDECADTDCSGCCTQNKGNKDELIDVESFTDAKWGVPDGAIQWADLGPTKGSGCN